MLDPQVQLSSYTHAGGGHTQHQQSIRSLTPDGQRVVSWAKTLPKRQCAAVAHAFSMLGLVVMDFMDNDDFGHEMAGNGGPRYDYHTGEYFDYGQATTGGVKICDDDSLLVAKRHR